MKQVKILVLTIVGLIVLVAALAVLKVSQFSAMAQASALTATSDIVTSADVREELWEPSLVAVGSLAPYQGVTVTTESSGIVTKILFEAGTPVQAGDLLITLDTSILEAQLQAAEARADLARLTAVRTRELVASNSSAKADLDSSEAQLKQSLADVASINAQIAQKQVRAPFSGRLGVRLINLGQYLDRGSAIVSLQSLDPIFVNFSLPQQQLAQLAVGMKTRVTVDAISDHVFEGTLTAINADVDASTRNVKVQATFNNRDERLRPGMFVNVAVILPTKEKVLIIPATAVLYAPFGDSVFVIEEKKDEKSGKLELILRQQFVRLGKARGDYVSVVSGLTAGQRIVSTGAFKLRNGSVVSIDNKLHPELSETPHPDNS
jgi:membrane fusion protein (multidrug efflux system)